MSHDICAPALLRLTRGAESYKVFNLRAISWRRFRGLRLSSQEPLMGETEDVGQRLDFGRRSISRGRDPGGLGLDLDADRLHEECGIFGIFGHPDAAAITALGLHALQHRGQEAAGIVT